MANGVPLKLLIPKGSDVRFDQRALGVTGAWAYGGDDELPAGMVITIDASALEALAPHPVLGPPPPSWLRRFLFPNG
jgi:hypothetical protein